MSGTATQAKALREGEWIEVSGKAVKVRKIEQDETGQIAIHCGPGIHLRVLPEEVLIVRDAPGRTHGVNVMARELNRGDWIEVDGEPRRITMISLTSIDRDYLITFSGGGHRVFAHKAKVTLLQFAEKVPVVRMDQLTAKLRQEFIIYVRGSEQETKPAVDRNAAKILAAGLAEVRFYLETGLDLTEQTRRQFEVMLALWWEEALTSGDVLRD